MDTFKSGFVSLIGRPNVGKSTLLNHFLQTKVAIVSNKPQTTRSCLQGVLTIPDVAQIIFVDTPGIHKPKHLLGEQIVQQAVQMVHEVDSLLFVVDGTEAPGPGDRYIARLFENSSIRPILLLNKLDKVPKKQYSRHLKAYQDLADFQDTFFISAKHSMNLKQVQAKLLEILPEGVMYYPNDQLTNQSEEIMIAELIREQVFRSTGEEIPHATSVLIENIEERSAELTYIQAAVIVERKSQKGIIIGKNGQKIKHIGQLARKSLQLFLQSEVYLELFVKVMPKWRSDRHKLHRLGYYEPE